MRHALDRRHLGKDQGVFDGFPDNTFRLNDPVNRGNYTRSLYNFAGAPDISGLPAHGFSDVTPFYADAVAWAKGNGLADDFPGGTYNQNDDINRGNASRIFYNTAQTKPAWADTMAAPPNMFFKNNLAPRPGPCSGTGRPPVAIRCAHREQRVGRA